MSRKSTQNDQNNDTIVVAKNNTSNISTVGAVTKAIGSGDNAKHSIILLTIIASFFGGAVFSITNLIILVYLKKYDSISFISDTKDIWAIFMPLITLSLGYAYGKSK